MEGPSKQAESWEHRIKGRARGLRLFGKGQMVLADVFKGRGEKPFQNIGPDLRFPDGRDRAFFPFLSGHGWVGRLAACKVGGKGMSGVPARARINPPAHPATSWPPLSAAPAPTTGVPAAQSPHHITAHQIQSPAPGPCAVVLQIAREMVS